MVTIQEKWMPSPHYSADRGPYNKAAIHTTEGATTIEALGSWFANPAAQCSSHHGADNYKRGVFGAYVYENHKAWTQGNANPYCLSIELCTVSGAAGGWSRDYWLNQQDTLVRNAADWVAYVCGKYGIPVVALSSSQAQDPNARGVCQHMNFGAWGSGHVDCGSGFPMDQVIAWAKGGAPPAQETPEEEMVPAVALDSQARAHRAKIGTDGKIYYAGPGVNGWRSVDPGANVKGGVSIAVSGPAVNITYINGGSHVCSYQLRSVADWSWGWADHGQV